MSKSEDFLVEIFTEELPPKQLLKLAQALSDGVQTRLQQAEMLFESVEVFATPRRLALLVHALHAKQKDQQIERRGPALAAAYDANKQPTPACMGFARSLNISPADLKVIKTPQGEWVGYTQHLPGKTVTELLPTIIEQAAKALPVAKWMRWGRGDIEFVRPVHHVLMLYGQEVVPATILGCKTARTTYGHRFLAPGVITIPTADAYASLLATEGYVQASFEARKKNIYKSAEECAQQFLGKDAQIVWDEALLNEVTGLVEWPTPICGHFDERFLTLPREVLISAMQDHQRYFPVQNTQQKLLPNFISISNIFAHDMSRVVHGNERVLRARLADAAFFYAEDQKENTEQRLQRLKGMLFQAKLGALYDKAQRLSKLSQFIAEEIKTDTELAARAGLFAKADLSAQMVNEFPELQGVMGGYYALHAHENKDVAEAIKTHYQPRFAGDVLPATVLGQTVALADRLDTLVGIFGIQQLPTGDKDPFGLRRAALGVIRIVIEKGLHVDLTKLLAQAVAQYNVSLPNAETVAQVQHFIQERLRMWYQTEGISADELQAVLALKINDLSDLHARVLAVHEFKSSDAAAALTAANKRVSNILSQYQQPIVAKTIDERLLEGDAERELARQLAALSESLKVFKQNKQYTQMLMTLATLRKPVDQFFDQVMVMVPEQKTRENRLLLLQQLRQAFLEVADIALLQ